MLGELHLQPPKVAEILGSKVEESHDREPDSETTTPLTLSHPQAMFTSSQFLSAACLAEAEKAQRLPETV